MNEQKKKRMQATPALNEDVSVREIERQALCALLCSPRTFLRAFLLLFPACSEVPGATWTWPSCWFCVSLVVPASPSLEGQGGRAFLADCVQLCWSPFGVRSDYFRFHGTVRGCFGSTRKTSGRSWQDTAGRSESIFLFGFWRTPKGTEEGWDS